MRLSFIFPLIVCTLCFSGVLSARAESSDEIYVVDMQRVIGESIIGKAARNTLESEAKKRQAALSAKASELEKAKAEIGKQSALLSPSALEEKRTSLEKGTRDLERLVQDNRDALSRKNNAEIEKIVAQVDEILKELGAKGKYKFILEKDRRVVVYADPKFDLTEQVIKTLDSKKIGL